MCNENYYIVVQRINENVNSFTPTEFFPSHLKSKPSSNCNLIQESRVGKALVTMVISLS